MVSQKSKNSLSKFKKDLQADWYIQSCPAAPLFLNTSAISGALIKKQLGFYYPKFIINYNHGQGEGCYNQTDLKRIWRLVYQHLQHDKNYLVKIKKFYLNNLKVYQPIFKKLSNDFVQSLSDSELLKLLKVLTAAQVDSVGVSHLIEAIGVNIEVDFKKELTHNFPELSDKRVGCLAANLNNISKKSWLRQEEDELRHLMKIKNHQKLLADHQNRYGWWINNSYIGPRIVSLAEFKSKGRELIRNQPVSIARPNLPAGQFRRLSRVAKELITVIDFVAIWQDERKVIILQAIGRLGLVIKEISRRLNWSPELIYHCGYSEVMSLKSIWSLYRQKKLLKTRQIGSVWLLRGGRDISLTKNYTRDFGRNFSMIKYQGDSSQEEIRGQIANPGTAIGRVSIVKGLESLKKIRPGDIIVVSMTRPEYTAALKKAAAIVTDEGGITSHAAIISRELNIPAIIGTKVGTKILHNGDQVEVRANHGVVKILQSN